MGRAWPAPLRGGRRGGVVIAIGTLAVAIFTVAAATPIHPILAQLAPDLRPDDASMSPIPTYEGDIVEVTVIIVNSGDTTAVSATIDLTDSPPNHEDVPIGSSDLTDPLAPGAFAAVLMPRFFAFGVGNHTLTIRVGNVTPAEANAADDVFSIRMQVFPAKAPPPPPPTDGVRIEALETLGIGVFLGFILIVLAIGVVVAFLARREPYDVGPPPPEPRDRSPPPIWPP